MRPADDIEQLVKNTRAETSTTIDEQILSAAQAALENSAPTQPNIWRTIMKNRITKFAAAAVIIFGLLLGVKYLGSPIDGAGVAYGITDLPELFRNVQTLHTKGYNYHYEPDPNFPEFVTTKIVPREVWLDVDRQRTRNITLMSYRPYGSNQSYIDRMEILSNNGFKMCLNDTKKNMFFNKLSPMRQKLDIRRKLDDYACLISPEMLEGFTRVGQEIIDGVEYDIWQCETLKGPQGHDFKVRCWLSPTTGQIGKIYRYYRPLEGDQSWRIVSSEEKIEFNIPIPEEIFEFNIPEDYDKPYDNSTPETASFDGIGPHGAGWKNGVEAQTGICFTLEDSSVIVCWRSYNEDENDEKQEHLFEDLKVGGEFPELPAVLEKLSFIPSVWTPGGRQKKVMYAGRHLCSTQKDGCFIEWGLYVPEIEPPTTLPRYIYRGLWRFTDEPDQPLEELNPLSGTRLEPDEFNEFVLGAMAELSEDGVAPADITYEGALQLAQEIRESLVE
ncbi:MAG: hypothetical protein ACYTFK_10765 [Planctomycetota bacterium]